jgi:hypothetical protein
MKNVDCRVEYLNLTVNVLCVFLCGSLELGEPGMQTCLKSALITSYLVGILSDLSELVSFLQCVDPRVLRRTLVCSLSGDRFI